MNRFLVSLFVGLISPTTLSSLAASRADEADHALVVVRGRAICLDVAGRTIESLFACNDANSRFGFASKDGRFYKFRPGDAMTTMFTDTRVRQRELQLTARLLASDLLEVIKVQSIKEGKVYDIFYFCDICTITAYAPGLCPCCRNELEFRETPQ